MQNKQKKNYSLTKLMTIAIDLFDFFFFFNYSLQFSYVNYSSIFAIDSKEMAALALTLARLS